MTSWPTDGYRDVTNVPHIEGLVAGLEFLLWLLTGHIPHYTPAPSCETTSHLGRGRPRLSLLLTRSLAVSAPSSASPGAARPATRLLAPSRIRSFPAGIGNAADALLLACGEPEEDRQQGGAR